MLHGLVCDRLLACSQVLFVLGALCHGRTIADVCKGAWKEVSNLHRGLSSIITYDFLEDDLDFMHNKAKANVPLPAVAVTNLSK